MHEDRDAQPASGRPDASVGRADPEASVSPEEGYRLLSVFRAIACPQARARVVGLAMAEASGDRGAPPAAPNEARAAAHPR